jgi:hypothetical protein
MQVLKVHVKLHPLANKFGKGWFSAVVFAHDGKIVLTSPAANRWKGREISEFMHNFQCLGAKITSKYVEKDIEEKRDGPAGSGSSCPDRRRSGQN